MQQTKEWNFEHQRAGKRLGGLLKMDGRRLLGKPSFYLFLAGCFVAPILIVVMTTMFGGAPAGEGQMTMEPFTHVWQVIESASGTASAGGMDMMSMCNSNLIYVAAIVFVCLFVTEDFRSGYAKHLFALHAKHADYAYAKILVCLCGCAGMMLAYWAGAMVGGAIAGLSFHTGAAGVGGVVLCLIAKLLLMAVFVSLGVLMSTVGKQRLWLALVGSLAALMILFAMISALTPLNAAIFHVVLCLLLGTGCSVGFGLISRAVLDKTALV